MNLPDVKEKFANQDIDLVSASPDQLADFIKSDWTLWDKVIKSTNIRLE